MSKALTDIDLIDIMPISLSKDKKIQALCEALTPELHNLSALLPYSALYENIDSLPENLVRMLAVDGGVYGPEWAIAGTLDKRKELVKDSFMLAKRRGTRWAVERIFEIIGWTVELKEWFEEGAAPYTWRISLLDINDIGLNEDQAKWLLALLDAYKPVSRVLTSINLTIDAPVAVTHAKIGVYFKAKIEG
jgi:phage tail P2-like protein